LSFSIIERRAVTTVRRPTLQSTPSVKSVSAEKLYVLKSVKRGHPQYPKGRGTLLR